MPESERIEIAVHMAITNNALKALTEQITKQNGRVTNLENIVSKLVNWKSYILGVGGAVGGMLTCAALIVQAWHH